MYQAAEEGEGGRDVGEVGGVEGRPNSQNSSDIVIFFAISRNALARSSL